jgi:carboxyl-terminal processing protease
MTTTPASSIGSRFIRSPVRHSIENAIPVAPVKQIHYNSYDDVLKGAVSVTNKSIRIFMSVSLGVGLFILLTGIAPSSNRSSDDLSLESLSLIARAVDLVDRNTSEGIDSRELLFSAIYGMFRTLDPYSQFLDEDSFRYMVAQQMGSFYGIGISFDVRNGELLVISPIEESPAWRLGIRAGDVIEEIEGENVAGITSNEVIKRLRGEKGSVVKLGIRRKGVSELLRFDVVRQKITLNSARGGFFLTPETAYIRLTEFSSTTYSEMIEKLETLESQGMKQLILDLRYNGGGLLSAAEQVSSAFLQKGDTIVSTKGRTSDTRNDMICRSDGKFRELPLIILVNDSSASASEIVAGAVQDHNRGLILGERTHGKGLVGSQFQTRMDTAVQVTTAQYFTPSGRNIQKPFDIPHRKAMSRGSTHDSNDGSENSSSKDTNDMGGGIIPDVIVEEPDMTPLMFFLESQRTFFDYAVNNSDDFKNIDETFVLTDELLSDFVKTVLGSHSEITENDISENRHTIRSSLHREIVSVHVNLDEADKLRVMELKAVQKALALFPEIDKHLAATDYASGMMVASQPKHSAE